LTAFPVTGFSQPISPTVKFGNVSHSPETSSYRIPLVVEGLDSLGAELVLMKLAFESSTQTPTKVELSERLEGKWTLFNRIWAGTTEADTLWIGMISQHKLYESGPLVQIVFDSEPIQTNGRMPKIIKATFKARSQNPVTAVVDSDFPVDISNDATQLPEEFGLQQNYPNPFNAGTRIEFQLPKRSPVQIDIFNLLGQKVATLVDEELSAGFHKVDWDGKIDGGHQAPSGVYIYSIKAGDFNQRKKMLLIR
jgi:hypothetical protein